VTSISENPQLLNINYKNTKDWIHMNGIDYNPILDQITFSSHNLNEWYVIDHSTTTAQAATHAGGRSGKGGDFLYRWGNPAAYSAAGAAVLKVTHDAHWIPEGVPNTGRLVGFNNQGVSASASAVDQVMPPRVGYTYTRATGAPFAPATYDARHAVAGYSSNMGSSQQLPNGNMLVCVATAGKVYEINSAGTQIWTKTFTGACPQAFKYDSCYVFNQPPAVPTITQTCTGLSLPAATTYQWYMNGDIIPGATTQTYTPTQNGAFVGRITDANGCVFRYSPTFDYAVTTATSTETATSCGFTNGASTVTATGSAPFTYTWSNGATTANVTNLAAGGYSVTVSNSLGCTTVLNPYISGSPPISVTATATPTVVGGSTGTASALTFGFDNPQTYLWDNAAITANISGLSAGTYCVTVTDILFNCSATACVDVVAVVGTDNTDNSINFTLSPNPTSDIITIKTNLSNYTATLSDLTGKVLLSQKDAQTFDLTAFANGVYFINIKTDTGATATQRIVKR
jgi:Secretion system C-terminal sorting domain/Arylsulfotransferase (ASST)